MPRSLRGEDSTPNLTMRQILGELATGNSSISDYFSEALEKWEGILSEHPPSDVDGLSNELHIQQDWFERNCGGRWLGQEVMVASGIAQFYDSKNGFDDDLDIARKIVEAFERSSCSMEVKGHARELSEYFDLDE